MCSAISSFLFSSGKRYHSRVLMNGYTITYFFCSSPPSQPYPAGFLAYMDGLVLDIYTCVGLMYFPKTVRYNFEATSRIFSTDSEANHKRNSASSLRPRVEYTLYIICEFLRMFSTSFADSSFAKSAIHLHLGSTLKKEKLKKYLVSWLMPSYLTGPYLKSNHVICD